MFELPVSTKRESGVQFSFGVVRDPRIITLTSGGGGADANVNNVVYELVGGGDAASGSLNKLAIELRVSTVLESLSVLLVALEERHGAREVQTLCDREGHRGIANLDNRVRSGGERKSHGGKES